LSRVSSRSDGGAGELFAVPVVTAVGRGVLVAGASGGGGRGAVALALGPVVVLPVVLAVAALGILPDGLLKIQHLTCYGLLTRDCQSTTIELVNINIWFFFFFFFFFFTNVKEKSTRYVDLIIRFMTL
jgi:hypothetical protein